MHSNCSLLNGQWSVLVLASRQYCLLNMKHPWRGKMRVDHANQRLLTRYPSILKDRFLRTNSLQSQEVKTLDFSKTFVYKVCKEFWKFHYMLRGKSNKVKLNHSTMLSWLQRWDVQQRGALVRCHGGIRLSFGAIPNWKAKLNAALHYIVSEASCATKPLAQPFLDDLNTFRKCLESRKCSKTCSILFSIFFQQRFSIPKTLQRVLL